MAAPSSTLTLYRGVDLNNRYEHTIWFEDEEKQRVWFDQRPTRTIPHVSFIRKRWKLKLQIPLEDAINYTYLSVDNGGKRYYYFINDVEYINDNVTEFDIEMDVMQTYMFDYTLNRCYVERNHVADDTIGANTVPENVYTGDPISMATRDWTELEPLSVMLLSTFHPELSTITERVDAYKGTGYHGIYAGVPVYSVPSTSANLSSLATKLAAFATHVDGIMGMWMYPTALIQEMSIEGDDEWLTHPVKTTNTLTTSISRPTNLYPSYAPRNNKLLTFPYNFLYVSNNQGGEAIYRYEWFDDPENCEFKASGAVSPDAVVHCRPLMYEGVTDNYEQGFTMTDYPTCTWNSDTYQIWLAQTRTTRTIAFAGGVITAVAGVATGNVGVAGGGIAAIAGSIGQQRDMRTRPDQANGRFSASVNVVNGKQTFTFHNKCITEENARIIDDFFDLYGYAIKRVTVPKTHTRTYWTYVKTIGCHISTNINGADQRQIEEIFDKGITFWTDGNLIGAYELPNDPLGGD